MNIKGNVKISELTTFRTGGNARFFCEVRNEEDIKKAFDFIEEKKLPFFIIGNGSNLLFSDKDFDGLLIKISIKGIKIDSENQDSKIVSAGAGENFDDLIEFSINNNLSGIENLWNIPGTIGASVVQNIGAYGAEVKDFIYSVEGIDTNTFEKFVFKNKDCNFEYRNSIFKKNKNLIITKLFFKLNNYFIPNLEYSALKEYFVDRKTQNINEVVKIIEKIRKNKLPNWKKLGTAGSFFMNPIVTNNKYQKLLKKYPDLPRYNAKNGFVKIPLGFVIDKICGLKGKRVGQVGLYEKQSLVVVNYGGAKFSEINNFAKIIEKEVYKKIKIKIEREVENIF